MPRLDVSTRKRVVVLRQNGHSVAEIRARLIEEGNLVSLVSIYKLLKKYECTGGVVDRKRKPSVRKILQSEHLHFIDEAMADDDELTARKLRDMLEQRWPGLKVSISSIKRVRKHDLGWICTRPKYCQLIRVANREKRLEWCQEMITAKETFDNVIWSDECSVQLDNHGRMCFRKVKQA